MTTYLRVSYNDRVQARSLGAHWDNKVKMWFIPELCPEDSREDLLNTFGEAREKPIYIHVPYDERHHAKRLGCKFDGEKKCWFIPRSIDEAFEAELLKDFKQL